MENTGLESLAEEIRKIIPPNSMYFGHPVNYYNTPEEEMLASTIKETFPKYNFYNPNNPRDQINYRLWKKITGKGMKYYFDVVLPEMEAGIFLPFEDGMFGAGVFGEMEFLYNQGKKVWEIDLNKTIAMIFRPDPSRMLSIEETRERVYSKK